MSIKPIPFSPPMVRALLDGRKSQTRRIPTRLKGFGNITEFGRSDTSGYDWHFRDKAMRWHDISDDRVFEVLPYQKGDLLYVREHWQALAEFDHLSPSEMEPTDDLLYVADRSDMLWNSRYRQGMHMPRWASRLTLVVSDVRVQWLQDISEVDARSEGVKPIYATDSYDRQVLDGWTDYQTGGTTDTAKISFETLWDSLNAKRAPWSSNPWVVAYSFSVIRENVDRLHREAAQ